MMNHTEVLKVLSRELAQHEKFAEYVQAIDWALGTMPEMAGALEALLDGKPLSAIEADLVLGNYRHGTEVEDDERTHVSQEG